MLPGVAPANNYATEDAVVKYVAPPFDTTLVIISHILSTKINIDMMTVRRKYMFWNHCFLLRSGRKAAGNGGG